MRTGLDMTNVMRTLADPTRRAVFEHIVVAGEVTAGALARNATVSQPAVSQHLRALREAKLVFERREAKHVYYHANPRGLAPMVDWLSLYGEFWRERFAKLEMVLKEIDL
ncbi:MAG: ArsR/SmtB family transcription factor [Methylocella sp.]